MPERTRINASNKEITLPLPVIQHIQSFLRGKQAARTSVVSKSWHNAWLTRPNLYFNQRCFEGCRHLCFWDFLRRTVQRYEELHINITSFELRMVSKYALFLIFSGNEVIKNVLKLAVNEADFTFKIEDSAVRFKVHSVLPVEDVEAETIVRLFEWWWKIDRSVDKNVKCTKLKSLTLEHTFIDDDLFRDTFPCLEDLTLLYCGGYQVLEISSTSLKCISIEDNRIIRAKFGIPNIRKLTFSGSSPPSLVLTEASMEWKADISLKYFDRSFKQFWFLDLKDLLSRLRVSMCKVSLSIGFYGYNGASGSIRPTSHDTPKLENLRLSLPSPFYGYDTLLGALFMTCRPKFITQYWHPKSCIEDKANNKLIKFLCKRLMQDEEKCAYMDCLEEAKAEIINGTETEWRPLLCKALLSGGSQSPNDKRKIRFQLDWRDE